MLSVYSLSPRPVYYLEATNIKCNHVSQPPSHAQLHIRRASTMGWSSSVACWRTGPVLNPASFVWREVLRTSKNRSKWEARDHEQSTIVSRSCYVWLGGFFQREKPRPHHEQSNSPLLELQFRLFVSVPSKDSCMGGIWPPNWLRLLHRCQSWLSEPVQGGGGFFGNGNRNGSGNNKYLIGSWDDGGDDDLSQKYGGFGKSRLTIYHWWAASLAVGWGLIWVLGAFSGTPCPASLPVSQIVDCLLWLGLLWCSLTFFLWVAKMVLLVAGWCLAPKNLSLNSLSLKNLTSNWSPDRQVLVWAKLDEMMARNIGAVPFLVFSIFFMSDLFHFVKKLNVMSTISAHLSNVYNHVKRGDCNLNSGGFSRRKQRLEIRSLPNRKL
ncbi:unnamed protein product [Sphagnum troendelagicum]|uniref:Uncharacterized protein n=1 Tax=Sphagnum troendelagicum TaxID=128251 RepID=A0ABP0UMJ6_9BRYO